MTLTLILMGFDGPLPDSHGPLGVGLRDAPPRGLMQRRKSVACGKLYHVKPANRDPQNL